MSDPDPWSQVRRFTPARVALGRAGSALPTAEVLRFALAHAQARDAVHAAMDAEALAAGLAGLGLDPLRAESAAPDRATYLARPDLGRRLSERSRQAVSSGAGEPQEIAIVIADGLSATAIDRHAVPLMQALLPHLAAHPGESGNRGSEPRLDPGFRRDERSRVRVVIASQARVALGDEIGSLLGARLVIVLIGERPGLSAPDGIGAYLTADPRPGRQDADRNCVSNIRPDGLPIDRAAARIAWLADQARRRGLTGVALKDESETLALT